MQRPKIYESHDLGHVPFSKKLRGHVRTVPRNMHVKFEVCSFNRFKLV